MTTDQGAGRFEQRLGDVLAEVKAKARADGLRSRVKLDSVIERVNAVMREQLSGVILVLRLVEVSAAGHRMELQALRPLPPIKFPESGRWDPLALLRLGATRYSTGVEFAALDTGSLWFAEEEYPKQRGKWMLVEDLEELFLERLFDPDSRVSRAVMDAATAAKAQS